jgi:hypothetical protein
MTPTHIRLLAMSHPDIPQEFSDWLMENFPIWERFEAEALRVAQSGREHYSAYTIREFIRHETALSEANSEFKFNNNHTPHLARLFAMAHPQHAELFAFKAVRRVA